MDEFGDDSMVARPHVCRPRILAGDSAAADEEATARVRAERGQLEQARVFQIALLAEAELLQEELNALHEEMREIHRQLSALRRRFPSLPAEPMPTGRAPVALVPPVAGSWPGSRGAGR
ncbi:hypothetical protein [Nocardia sp. alder85J]|uniref:hypothetical protein n=1 Tax=Nocardia sp. alder85J TaxID=2862949 RepID=UPI001CD76ECE|nr:hypothetical protein [Nocardia sp. alder85J]MCX4091101.1 hypothetical protein [Nocardia sp. alder85J]